MSSSVSLASSIASDTACPKGWVSSRVYGWTWQCVSLLPNEASSVRHRVYRHLVSCRHGYRSHFDMSRKFARIPRGHRSRVDSLCAQRFYILLEFFDDVASTHLCVGSDHCGPGTDNFRLSNAVFATYQWSRHCNLRAALSEFSIQMPRALVIQCASCCVSGFILCYHHYQHRDLCPWCLCRCRCCIVLVRTASTPPYPDTVDPMNRSGSMLGSQLSNVS